MNTARHRVLPRTHLARLALAALTVLSGATCGAEEPAMARDPLPASAPDAAPDPSAPGAVTPRVNHHHAGRQLTVAQSIDESVQRLTRGLNLDAGQQERLREILVSQHRQMMQLRSGGAAGAGDVTGATMALYDQTRARIRALLTAEQLEKYPAALPRDQTAPAQADLQKWMQMQESRRLQDDAASH